MELLEPNGTNLLRTPDSVTTKGGRGNSVSHRWYFVISLHLAGYTYEEISELSGYQIATIQGILRDDRSVHIRQQLLRSVDDEFEALYSQVVSVIRDKLRSKDERIQLAATDQWFKAHGKYQPKQTGLNVTAEDVVIQILNQKE